MTQFRTVGSFQLGAKRGSFSPQSTDKMRRTLLCIIGPELQNHFSGAAGDVT